MSQDYEGWEVRARPAIIAVVAFAASMMAIVALGGAIYVHTLEPKVQPLILVHQHPALETISSAPSDKDQVPPPQPPRATGAAMAQVAAEGDALWGAKR